MQARILATALGAALCLPALAAATPEQMRLEFEQAARQAQPGFGAASPQRGEAFFKRTHGGEWSCSSCHGENPRAVGRHAKTGKPIDPLAPAANAERFTRPDKVEKWFKRNCQDVLNRACTPAEKGDILAYLMSLGR